MANALSSLVGDYIGVDPSTVDTTATLLMQAGQLATAKSAADVISTITAILKPLINWACEIGVAALLAMAPASVGSSVVAAGVLQTACFTGATAAIEYLVKSNYGSLFADTISETLRKYYSAIYGTTPSDELVAEMTRVRAAEKAIALDTILKIAERPIYNPEVIKEIARQLALKKALELQRIREQIEARRKFDAQVRTLRLNKLAFTFADLPAERMEPVRRYLVHLGPTGKDMLAVFDQVLERRGIKLKADGNITWPALTVGALAVGAFIIWRAKSRR